MMNQEELQISESDGLEFEKLLTESFDATKVGELIMGTVIAVERDYVRVDIGFKSEGQIPLSQFADFNGDVNVAVDDEVEVLLLASENEMGEVVLSKDRAEQLRVWERLEVTFDKNELVKGRVVQKVKGGLQVDVGVPAFLPGSQIDVRPQRNLDKFVGEAYEFRILKFSRERGNIVLSRRVVLEEERNALKKDTLEHLTEGVVMEGVVKNITDYGAFIDLGGIDGLLHITDMSWGRVTHPSEILTAGQTIPVVVLKYDRERERVSLGMKQLNPNPWEEVESRYTPDTVVKGNVVSLTDYGAFVRLEEGIEGLIHVSEMSWTKKIKHPSKVLNIGDEVEAKVLEVSAEQQRISLGLKQLAENPWDQLAAKYPEGTRITGSIRSITDFGLFVTVEGEIDGLVHVSDLSWTKRNWDPKEIQDKYNRGDEIEVIVLAVDPDNERLGLGVKQLTPDVWEQVPHRYPAGVRVKGKVNSVTDFGVFVELEEGVEGLIHVSQLGLQKGDDHRDKYGVGAEIEADVVNVDRSERRISLSMKPAKKGRQKEDFAQYLEDDSAGAVTFGDLLQEQMDLSKDSGEEE